MTRRTVSIGLLLLGVMAIAVFGVAQDAPTEAPAGFDTPTLTQNPGSQSQSNGIVELAGDTYALDQQIYETTHDVTTGLGPVYKRASLRRMPSKPRKRREQPVHGAAGRASRCQRKFREPHRAHQRRSEHD